MPTWLMVVLLIGAGLAVWFVVGLAVALVVGGMMRSDDHASDGGPRLKIVPAPRDASGAAPTPEDTAP